MLGLDSTVAKLEQANRDLQNRLQLLEILLDAIGQGLFKYRWVDLKTQAQKDKDRR